MSPQELPLRPLHAPPPLAGWLPTWFEALLGLVLLLLLLGAWRWGRRTLRHRIWRRRLERGLAQVEALGHLDSQQGVAEAGRLLRRIMLAHHHRAEVAGLVGEEWLGLLDRFTESSYFTRGEGRALIVESFAATPGPNTMGIMVDACRRVVAASARRAEEATRA